MGDHALGWYFSKCQKSQTFVFPLVDPPALVFLLQEQVATQDLEDASTGSVMGNHNRTVKLCLDTPEDVKDEPWVMDGANICRRSLPDPIVGRWKASFCERWMDGERGNVRQ